MRRFLLTVVVFFLMFGSTQAQTAWGDLGSLLRTACGTVTGGVGIPIPGGSPIQIGGISSLEWICTINSMYSFVDGNIINGDWSGFASEVAGTWGTELANYLVNQTGVGSFSGWLNTANDAMRGSYRDFRKKIMAAMREAINAPPNIIDNPGFDVTTAGGLADDYEKTSPLLRVAGDAVRIANTTDQFQHLERGFKARKMLEESQDAVDKALSPALTKATQIIGTPLSEGEADGFSKKAQTANSTRVVMETQVEATASLMKQQAVFSSAILNLLSEIAKQGVMTNNTLGNKRDEAADAVNSTYDGLKAGLEDMAQENLDNARSTATNVKNLQAVTNMLYDSATINGTDWSEFAP